MYMTVTFLSHVIDIDWSNDGIQPGDLGPMMGIDRVWPHHLIGVDWAQNQSRYILKLIKMNFDKDLRGTNHSLQY